MENINNYYLHINVSEISVYGIQHNCNLLDEGRRRTKGNR